MNKRILKNLMEFIFYITIHQLPKNNIWNRLRGLIFKFFGAFSPYLHLNKGDNVLYGGCFMIETVNEVTNAIGKQGMMYVAEADEECVDRLNFDIERRYIDNVKVFNMGVWGRKEKIEFEISRISHRNQIKDKTIYSEAISESDFDKTKIIEVDSIDNIVHQLGLKKLDAVFLTISGAEKEALLGLKNTINKFSPHLIIRCAFIDKTTEKPVYHQIKQSLESSGFKVYLGKKNKNSAVRNMYAFKNVLNG